VIASCPIATPSAWATTGLNVEATEISLGNCVTPVRFPATPLGPSVSVNAGMHSRGTPMLMFSIGPVWLTTTKFTNSEFVILAATSRARTPADAWWSWL